MWTLVVIMVCDTPSRDDHEVQSNRTCILLPGNMRLRFNRFVYFWRGFYLYVHGDANAFVLRKINSILMRKLTSQKISNFFFRIDWEQLKLEIGHFERHEIDIVVHYCPQDGPSRPSCQGKGKKTWRKLFSSWPLAKPSRYRIVQHVLGSTITMVSAHRRISLEYFLK